MAGSGPGPVKFAAELGLQSFTSLPPGDIRLVLAQEYLFLHFRTLVLRF